MVDRVISVTLSSFGGPGTSAPRNKLQSEIQEQQNNDPIYNTLLLKKLFREKCLEKNRLRFVVKQFRVYGGLRSISKQHRHTEDIDSDVDVFLSRLVLGGDGVASRVAPQTDRDGHNGRVVCGLNLNINK